VIDSFAFVAYDSLPATIIDSGLFTYSDFHVDLLNTAYSNPPGYKWMAWQTTDTMLMEEGKMWFDPLLVTDEQVGYYHLRYVSGWNDSIAASDFGEPMLTICGTMEDTCWVTNTNDSGEGSLRYAVYNTKTEGHIRFSISESDTIKLDSTINIYRGININKYYEAGYLINIQGPSYGNAIYVRYTNASFLYNNKVFINELNVFGAGGAGINVSDLYRASIYNSSIHDNQGPGIQFKDEIIQEHHTAEIYRCEVYNNHSSGLYFEGNGYGSISLGDNQIYNNTAVKGGGIYAKDCSLGLHWDHFVIENNSAEMGGGIYYEGWEAEYGKSTLHLSDVIIRDNNASTGGGIYVMSGELETDDWELHLSNIYLNDAPMASDIFYNTDEEFEIHLDTFSVLHPTGNYILAQGNNTLTPYNYHINHGMIEQYSQDLYVSPGGSDDNDGLSWQAPKKTIRGATRVCDPSLPVTVHLDSGYFSVEQNGEIFPLRLEPNVILQGMGQELTFLGPAATVFEILHDKEVHMSNMTIQGYDRAIICNNANIYLEHITLENLYTPGTGQAIDGHTNDIILNNCRVKSFRYGVWSWGYLYADSCIFIDNNQAALIDIGSSDHGIRIPLITNTRFIRNGRGVTQCDRLIAHNIAGENNGVTISVDEHLEISNSSFTGNKSGIWFSGDTLIVDSCSFIANDAYKGDPFAFGYKQGAGILMRPSLVDHVYLRLSHSLFQDNIAEFGAGLCHQLHQNATIAKASDMKIQHCIFERNQSATYGNGSAIYFSLSDYIQNSVGLGLINCLVNDNEGGKSAIFSGKNCNLNLVNTTLADNDAQYGIFTSSNDTLNIINSILRHDVDDMIHYADVFPVVSYSNIEGGWEGTGNIDEDPLFDSLGIHPYQLLNDSPCVNSGSPDTNGLNIPIYDLGGNYRITGDRIDMGAYECLFTAIPGHTHSVNNVTIYPNPVIREVTIDIDLKESGQVQVCLYNHLGQVERLFDEAYMPSGRHLIRMNVTDLPPGTYFLKVTAVKEAHTSKLVRLR
jgi:predicted outer membrane repeat protein